MRCHPIRWRNVRSIEGAEPCMCNRWVGTGSGGAVWGWGGAPRGWRIESVGSLREDATRMISSLPLSGDSGCFYLRPGKLQWRNCPYMDTHWSDVSMEPPHNGTLERRGGCRLAADRIVYIQPSTLTGGRHRIWHSTQGDPPNFIHYYLQISSFLEWLFTTDNYCIPNWPSQHCVLLHYC